MPHSSDIPFTRWRELWYQLWSTIELEIFMVLFPSDRHVLFTDLTIELWTTVWVKGIPRPAHVMYVSQISWAMIFLMSDLNLMLITQWPYQAGIE